MRLFELFDIGSIRSVLAVKQGEADKAGPAKQGIPSTIPFAALKSYLEPLGINSPDGLIALKNKVDPAGDVIADIDKDGNITLKTKIQNPNQDKAQQTGGGPAVDAMASSNAKTLAPKI